MEGADRVCLIQAAVVSCQSMDVVVHHARQQSAYPVSFTTPLKHARELTTATADHGWTGTIFLSNHLREPATYQPTSNDQRPSTENCRLPPDLLCCVKSQSIHTPT